jgi:DNA-binding response OmpR family regulator
MEFPAFSSPQQPQHRLLYVGNDLDMMNSLQEALRPEGWFVVRSPDGSTARLFLASRIPYDFLLFDEELTDTSGMKMVRFARTLEQRRRTPIIILLLKGRAVKARRADAHEFLWRPERLQALVETIRRRLASSGRK